MNRLAQQSFQTKLTLTAFCSSNRSVSVKSWPTLDNPWRERLDVSKQTTYPRKYVVSKEEFKYVEMLKPMDTIPLPPVNVKITPSGWVPPRRESLFIWMRLSSRIYFYTTFISSFHD